MFSTRLLIHSQINIHLHFSNHLQCADLPSTFIRHLNDEVQKLRGNIASEPVTSTSKPVTGTTTATFYSFEKVPQSTVKEYIIYSDPKPRDYDPIPTELVMECLYSILPSFTDPLDASLATNIFP